MYIKIVQKEFKTKYWIFFNLFIFTIRVMLLTALNVSMCLHILYIVVVATYNISPAGFQFVLICFCSLPVPTMCIIAAPTPDASPCQMKCTKWFSPRRRVNATAKARLWRWRRQMCPNGIVIQLLMESGERCLAEPTVNNRINLQTYVSVLVKT